MMKVAHDRMPDEQMEVKKTKDWIFTNFYLLGIHQDVVRFCRSRDVSQKIVSKGSVAKVPLSKMPLLELFFKHMAVDLIGLITPARNKGHHYMLALV